MDSSDFSMFVRMFVGSGGDKNRCIGTLLPPDCAMPSTTAGSDESWEGRGCQAEPRPGTIADSCSSFHHYKVWKGPLSSPENSLWLSNSHGSCYRVIGCDFSKPHFTLSLRHCQLSPWLQRERMEPGWRLSKHAHRLCVLPPLETTLRGGEGFSHPEVFILGNWDFPGPLVYERSVLWIISCPHSKKTYQGCHETHLQYSTSILGKVYFYSFSLPPMLNILSCIWIALKNQNENPQQWTNPLSLFQNKREVKSKVICFQLIHFWDGSYPGLWK